VKNRAAAVAILLAFVLIAPAGASAKTYLGGCYTGDSARFKPHGIIITCADANYRLRRLHWRKWSDRVAKGRGQAYVNDCDPFCAAGHFHSYPVKVRLSRVGSCATGPRRQFLRVLIHYTHARPAGLKRTERVPRACGT
jgi:hypothetical protein